MLHVSGEIVRVACLTGRFGNPPSLTASRPIAVRLARVSVRLNADARGDLKLTSTATLSVAAAVPYSARACALQTTSKAVLPGYADQVVAIAGACRHALAGVELYRMLSIHRKRQGPPEAPVLLQVVVQHAIDG